MNITVMIFIVIVVISSVAYFEFKESLMKNLDYRLRSDAESTFSFFTLNESDTEMNQHISSFLGSQAHKHRLGFGLWFDKGGGHAITSDNFHSIREKLIPPENDTPERPQYNFSNIEYKDRPYRVLWAKYRVNTKDFKDRGDLNVVVAIGSNSLWDEVGEFLRLLIILGAISIWVCIGLVMLILRWGLKPVNEIAMQMNDISGAKISHSVSDIKNVSEELRPFITAWDSMLSRIAETVRRQKRFTADASHELRTPLAVMKSTLQLARLKKRSAQEYESAMDQCLEDMQRMERLIDQLLDLSNCDDESKQLHLERVDITDILSDVVSNYTGIAAEGGQSIKLRACKALVSCDRQQITRAVSNLVENAIKYGPSQSEILITAKVDDGAIVITVHDAGGSIAPDKLERIFDRFYRVDISRSHKSGNAGLGLAIARQIVTRHRGDIRVESDPEAGTDFIIRLPRLDTQ